jgi:hypothetical protein
MKKISQYNIRRVLEEAAVSMASQAFSMKKLCQYNIRRVLEEEAMSAWHHNDLYEEAMSV